MATAADFMADIRTRAPGVPEPLVEYAVLKAAIDFCEKTNIYALPGRANSVVGQAYFDVAVADAVNTELHQMRRVWYKSNPRPLDNVAPTGVLTPFAHFSTIDGQTAPKAAPTCWFETPDNRTRIGVFYAPDEAIVNAFTFVVALKPTQTAAVIPDILKRDWYWGIVWGALQEIRSIPNQPYSGTPNDPAEIMFAREVLKAKVAADRGLSPGAMSVEMRPFAWGSKQWR